MVDQNLAADYGRGEGGVKAAQDYMNSPGSGP